MQQEEGIYRRLFLYYCGSFAPFSNGFVKTKESAEKVVGDMMLTILWLMEKLAGVDNLTVRKDGFAHKEVAGILNILETTVDWHLNNALHKLVNEMKAI